MKIPVDCNICKTTGKLVNGEGGELRCPYCRGTGKREKIVPHPSHKMTIWRCEIRCPCDEPRFYGVRNCKLCGEEELEHPAGHFMNRLEEECPCAELAQKGEDDAG